MLSAPRLDPDDQAVGPQLLDRAGDAGEQPAAADRDDDRIELGRLLEPFQATVAVPRAVNGPSNGSTNARPSSRPIRSAVAKPSAMSGTSTSSAP